MAHPSEDPSRCLAADRCAIAECGHGIVRREVCGSNFAVVGYEAFVCVEESCCDEVMTCTRGGSELGECLDCIEDGGGPACDELIACQAGCGV